MKEIVYTAAGPDPIGPYSQAVKAGPFLFVSGQIAIDPATQTLHTDSLTDEVHQVMKNIGAILEAAGMNFDHVVKTSIFLKNMEQFSQVNDLYGQYFSGNYPARETVEVSRLPKGVNVEISVIAASA